jgi:hypothetical protein
MLMPKKINGQWFQGDQPIGEPQVVTDEEMKQYVETQLGSVGKLVTPSDCKSDADGIAGSSPAAPTNDLPRM